MSLKFILLTFLIQLVASSMEPSPEILESLRPMREHPMFDEFYRSFDTNDTEEAEEAPMGGRIYNGLRATLGQFPYQVLLYVSDGLYFYACGGSIISDKVILTAAHCLYNRTGGVIFAGTVNLKGSKAFITTFSSSDFIVHENYSKTATIVNDIAVIKLPKALPCHRHIGIVDLPCDCDMLTDLESEVLTAAGFGMTFDNGTLSSDMNYITIDGEMSNCKCNSLTPLHIVESIICIGIKDGRTVCSGDSGSPLTAQIHGRNVLVGITSFVTSRFCSKTLFAGFTRVSSFRQWIRDVSGV